MATAAQNMPATLAAEQKEIIYTAADGQEIRLTPEMVRKYLVQGHGEMVTIQEMVYFLNVCRSRKSVHQGLLPDQIQPERSCGSRYIR
jgi:hypothetical protein